MITFNFCELDSTSEFSNFILASIDMLKYSDFTFEFKPSKNLDINIVDALTSIIDNQINENAIIYSNGSKLDTLISEIIKYKKPSVQIKTLNSISQCNLQLFDLLKSELSPNEIGYLQILNSNNTAGLVVADAFTSLSNNPKSQIVFLSPFFHLYTNENKVFGKMRFDQLPYFIFELFNIDRVIPSILLRLIDVVPLSNIKTTDDFFKECFNSLNSNIDMFYSIDQIVLKLEKEQQNLKIPTRAGSLLSLNAICLNDLFKK